MSKFAGILKRQNSESLKEEVPEVKRERLPHPLADRDPVSESPKEKVPEVKRERLPHPLRVGVEYTTKPPELTQVEVQYTPTPPQEVSYRVYTPQPAGPKPTGRPRAKRSDPAFTQITAYIRKDTYAEARKLLIDRGDQDFSELLEELTASWVKQHKP